MGKILTFGCKVKPRLPKIWPISETLTDFHKEFEILLTFRRHITHRL